MVTKRAFFHSRSLSRQSADKAQGKILTEVGSSSRKHSLLLMLVFQLLANTTLDKLPCFDFNFSVRSYWVHYVNISVDSHHLQF